MLWLMSLAMLLATPARGAAKPHVIAFGKWMTAKLAEPAESGAAELKIRGLIVDGHLKEFTIGLPHDVTEQVFVVRRMVRLNDVLPGDAQASPRWIWQPAGWLLVDRRSGRISPANLPNFEPFTSEAVWFRDYAAYCGTSGDGQKLYAMVVQLGHRKPILAKVLSEGKVGSARQAQCAAPAWQRQPVRVTFPLGDNDRFTFSVREFAVTIPGDEGADDGDGN
jgi:hypothetical protein